MGVARVAMLQGKSPKEAAQAIKDHLANVAALEEAQASPEEANPTEKRPLRVAD